jgi:hypothetical protein
MKLHHLKEEKCQHCGAGARSESVTGQHVNGQFFEERVFSCHAAIRWSPNFNRQEVVRLCEKDPVVIKRRKVADKLLRDCLFLVDAANIEDRHKCSIKNGLHTSFEPTRP